MEVKLIIFDWDGTLADSSGRIISAMQKAFSNRGVTTPKAAAVQYVIGLSLEEAIAHLAADLPSRTRRSLENEYREQFALQAAQTELFNGARDVLEYFHTRGLDLAVATGKSLGGLQRALEETNSAHYFSSIRTADECASKPAPDMLEEIVFETGHDKRHSIMVGDTTFDLEMARNAGIASIAACYGAHRRNMLAQYSPLHLLDSIEELKTTEIFT